MIAAIIISVVAVLILVLVFFCALCNNLTDDDYEKYGEDL